MPQVSPAVIKPAAGRIMYAPTPVNSIKANMNKLALVARQPLALRRANNFFTYAPTVGAWTNVSHIEG
jgi:hypothetical protein